MYPPKKIQTADEYDPQHYSFPKIVLSEITRVTRNNTGMYAKEGSQQTFEMQKRHFV